MGSIGAVRVGGLSILALLATPEANAAVQFSGNGHFYEYVAGPELTWADANVAAFSTFFNGMQGYLATITSAAENDFLAQTFGTATVADPNGSVGWLGGSDSAVEGDWRWTTGPEMGQLFYQGQAPGGVTLTYSNWSAAEPDDDGPGEDYLVFRESGWNDLRASAVRGYYIEYGFLSVPVPEPGAWATMLIGFGLVGAAARRGRGRPAAAA